MKIKKNYFLLKKIAENNKTFYNELQSISFLRSRLESEIFAKRNGLIDNKNSNKDQDLEEILQLVKEGERILSRISTKKEHIHIVKDFITIMEDASRSIALIKDISLINAQAESTFEELVDLVSFVSSSTDIDKTCTNFIHLFNDEELSNKYNYKDMSVTEEKKQAFPSPDIPETSKIPA